VVDTTMSARVVRAARRRWIPLTLLLAALIATWFLSPVFFQARNIINVARQASIVGVVSVGMTFVILTGGIDLSVGSTLALSAITSAMMLDGGVPPVVVILVQLAVGSAVGLVNGLGVAVTRVQPFIMTLATMAIVRGLALHITQGYPQYFDTQSKLIDFFGGGEVGPFPGQLLIFLGIAAVGWLVLRYVPFGRFVFAVGGSAEAARLSGVRTGRTVVATYVISGACAAIAGVMTAARLGVGAPIAGNLVELDAIAAVVIGGTTLAGGAGGMGGTVLGALLLAVLSNILNLLGVSPFDQQIAKGAVILVAVLFASSHVIRGHRRRNGGDARSVPTAVDHSSELVMHAGSETKGGSV
jgi:ribose transport system permease protein